jgi:TRAP-type C4-dicarboxylate transport system substrate-binding protein
MFRVVCPLLAAFAVLAFSAGSPALTLKVATIVPDGSAWMTEMRAVAKEVEEKTEGRVRFKFYPGGVMGNSNTVLRKIRAGQLQGAAFTSGALADIDPDIDLYGMPLMFRNYDEVDYVRARMDDTLKAGLERKGFVALAISDGGFAYVMSRKPMRTMDDVRKGKVWIQEGDEMTEVTFDIAGISPVQLPIADVYTALQTGLIDTIGAPPAGAIALQWHSKVKYLTDFPLTYLIGVFAIDARAFAKISPEDQKIVRETVAAASRRLDADARTGEANAKEALRKQGIQFVSVASDAERASWEDIAARSLKALRAKKVYDEDVMDAILGYLQEFRDRTAAAAPPASGK